MKLLQFVWFWYNTICKKLNMFWNIFRLNTFVIAYSLHPELHNSIELYWSCFSLNCREATSGLRLIRTTTTNPIWARNSSRRFRTITMAFFLRSALSSISNDSRTSENIAADKTSKKSPKSKFPLKLVSLQFGFPFLFF